MTCQHRGCGEFGIPYLEPAGVWCVAHRPQLWKDPFNDWHTPRCWRCGDPAGYPNTPPGNTFTRPVCRAHAPRWMRPYLTATQETP